MNFSGKSMPGKPGKEKLSAIIITLTIIAVLVLSGPASAFNVSLTGFAVLSPTQGDKISTTASVEINSGERMTIVNPIGVYVDGIDVCVFSINAQSGDCDGSKGISVSLVSNTSGFGYGYGYGYGYSYGYGYQNGYLTGKFTYNITLDTSNFTIGEHKIKLIVNAGNNNIYDSDEVEITIKPQGAETIETKENIAPNTEEKFNNNKVSVRLGGSTSGKLTVATFTSQPLGTSSFGLPGLGKYLQIEADSAVLGDMANTEIRVYYTDAEVSAAGLDEASLRLAYYNATSGSWQKYDSPNGGVNTTGNYVYAVTNHFSIWGIFGNTPSSTAGGGEIYSRNNNKNNKEKCTTSWSCSQWRNCINSMQTRICKPVIENCYAGEMPAQSRACAGNQTVFEGEPILKEPTPTQQGFFSGITGAVTGPLGTVGMIIIVLFIFGILALSITIFMVRRRKRRINTTNIVKGY